MEQNKLILGQDRYYSLDTRRTRLNNNVIGVGASGSGKTRGIVIPNLLQACGSYVISDPKGNLYGKYKGYLEKQGYTIKKLDFTDPEHSARYNFLSYIRNTQDIVKVAHMLVFQRKEGGHYDPFWDEASQLLVQSLIAHVREADIPEEKKNFGRVLQLLRYANVQGNMDCERSVLDMIMAENAKGSYAAAMYQKFRVAANRTLRSILITVNARFGAFDTPEMYRMMSSEEIDIPSIGKRKTALFVVVSDTDRSLDGLVNIFFTQAMHELCRFADHECQDCCLPVPVTFILDDFATNCKIEEFPRMISSIRSRAISVILMIQAESQLTECYGYDGRTILSNCDSYVYLGGNDVETAKAVAERCDVPLKKILNMPVETSWVFRRGQPPLYGKNFDLESFLIEKGLQEKTPHTAKRYIQKEIKNRIREARMAQESPMTG